MHVSDRGALRLAYRLGLVLASLGMAAAPCLSEGIEWIANNPETLVQSVDSYKDVRAGTDSWQGTVVDGGDPKILLAPFDIDASAEKYLYLKLEVADARGLQLFFCEGPDHLSTEASSLRSAITLPLETPTILRFDLSDHDEWTGTIGSLRLDVDGAATGSWVRLYRVGISAEPVQAEGVLEAAAPDDEYAAHVAPTDPLAPEEQIERFVLPPGFEIQLVASEPEIQKPFNINFDHRGRLWVTGSEEYPFPATDEAKARDTIKILDNFGPDGRAGKVTTFADGLNIPIGVLPLSDGAIGWSLPSVYKFHDKDGDDRAESRERMFGPFGYDDTHGNINAFTWGFDGWVYACHGFRNHSIVEGGDGHKIDMTSGHVWRFRPDGSRCEIFSYGQVNPFGICFDPYGNLYSADCHSRPVYQLLHGGDYPTFSPESKDGLGFAPEICFHSHDSTAIGGALYYAADQFPAEYLDRFFVGNVVTIRVNQDTIEREGGTYKAVLEPDFVRCRDPWFRPVDIQVGPDGSVYIADFYNRIIGHYEVPLEHPGRDRTRGRIWRVVYKGDAETAPAPDWNGKDWLKESVEESIESLGHPNLWVRLQATNRLSWGGEEEISTRVQETIDASDQDPFRIAHGLWVLARRGDLDSATLAARANSEHLLVRVHAQKILAERGEATAEEMGLALAGLEDTDGLVRRNAAEALRRRPAPEYLIPLLATLEQTPKEDKQLRHVLRMAAREALALNETWDVVYRELIGTDAVAPLADIAFGSRTGQAAEFLLQELIRTRPRANSKENAKEIREYAAHISRYVPDTHILRLLDELREATVGTLEPQTRTLKAVNTGFQRGGKSWPVPFKQWAVEVAQSCLDDASEDFLRIGAELVGALKLSSLSLRLVALCENREFDDDPRKAACVSLLQLGFDQNRETVAAVFADVEETDSLRNSLAELFGKYNRDGAVEALAVQLRTAPAGLARRIAKALASTDRGAGRLVAEIEEGKASRRLLLSRDVTGRFRDRKVENLKQRVAALTEGLVSEEEAIRKLIGERKKGFLSDGGDVTLGAEVFKNKCAACHKIGEVGEKIAPELDGIGARGLDRILEDLLDPSLNVDQAYRTTIVETITGELHSGLEKGEEGEVLLLADAEGKIQRIPLDDIDDTRKSNLSPMPSDIASALPEQELRNLVAFLLGQKSVD